MVKEMGRLFVVLNCWVGRGLGECCGIGCIGKPYKLEISTNTFQDDAITSRGV